MGKQWLALFFWAPKSLQMVTAAMNLKDTYSLKESYDQPKQCIKKQRHYFVHKYLSSQGYGFSSGHVWMWELDHKEGWVLKNWCFWTVVLEKTLESPLVSKEVKPVNPKVNQPSICIGSAFSDAEVPILWKLKADSLEKTLILGKTEGRRRRRWQEKMIEWHHQLNRHEFKQAPVNGEEQGSLTFFSPWGHKESDMNERVNNNFGVGSPRDQR